MLEHPRTKGGVFYAMISEPGYQSCGCLFFSSTLSKRQRVAVTRDGKSSATIAFMMMSNVSIRYFRSVCYVGTVGISECAKGIGVAVTPMCIESMLAVKADGETESPLHKQKEGGEKEHQLDVHATSAKLLTFEICEQMRLLLNDKSAQNFTVTRNILHSVYKKSKQTNILITKLITLQRQELERGEIDMHLMKHAVFQDTLDREATFTQTLEAIGDEDGVDCVTKAIRFVGIVNGQNGLSRLSKNTFEAMNLADEAAEFIEDINHN